MTRRFFLSAGAALPALAGREPEPRVPIEQDELNVFARTYNVYAAKLRDGIVDTNQWRRVRLAWKRLTGETSC